jgi:site-specific recombinase XerD
LKKDLCRSLSTSARRQYTTYWRRFSRFTTDILQTSPLPSTSYSVALYVTHLAKTKLKSTTIRSHLSAIAYYHKVHGFSNPSDSFLISKLLLSHKKRDGPISVRRPITVSILRQLLSALNSSEYSSHKRKLFQSVFTIMYHAALRASEVCVTPEAQHTLQKSHIALIPSTGAKALKIKFQSYKHSRGQPCPLILHASGKKTCAVVAYKSYAGTHIGATGPAFLDEDNTPLSRQSLANTLHGLLTRIHLKPHLYNTHSFSIGKATDMAKQEFSYSQFAMLGRWKSNAFLRYIKPTIVHGSH